jgi:hypothetical protein
VVVRSGLELLSPGVGQLRVDDSRVAVAGGFLDEAAALQSVEQARDSRRREQHLLREIDPPHHAVRRSGQSEEHLVVVDRQAVVGDELAVEPTDHARMRPDKADERLNLHAFQGSLRTHPANCSAIRGR